MKTPKQQMDRPAIPLTGKDKLQVAMFLGCWLGAQIGIAMFMKGRENKEKGKKGEEDACRGR